jgi:hypothetical protein
MLIKETIKIIMRNYGIRQIRKHGFWFVDIPRTSSTGIKNELVKMYGVTYSKGKLGENRYYHKLRYIFPPHLPAQQMRKILGEELWARIFTFTIIRNPWDRMVSLFHYMKREGSLPKKITFRDYVLQFNTPRYMLKNQSHGYHAYYYGLSEYIVDSDDNVIVDYIGRYENRMEDIRIITDKIGCQDLGNLHLEKIGRSHKHYSQYYDDETKDVISRVFKRDIERFEYSFEEKK